MAVAVHGHMYVRWHGLAATHTVTHSNTLQNNTTHCNTLQNTETHCKHCNTLQHTATHCNMSLPGACTSEGPASVHVWRLLALNKALCDTMQHNATQLQHTITHCNTTATHCNSLQLTATHCNTGDYLLLTRYML